MIAIGLLKGDLVAEDYEDDVASDPRIDQLRSKMDIKEDERYSREYHEADKRSIANRIQIHFNDGTSSEVIEVEYPIGHKRRREEGIPVLEQKFKRNLELTYGKEKANLIFEKCINQEEFEKMSVIDFQEMLTVSTNKF
jgi:2-methylcitrate dehydratase